MKVAMAEDRGSRRLRIGILDNDVCALMMMDMLIRHRKPDMEVIWKETKPQRLMEHITYDALQPDVVILDLVLNGISGVDVCREIRRRSSTIRLIGVTAYPLEQYRARLVDAGAQALVSKDSVGSTMFVDVLRGSNQHGFRDEGADIVQDGNQEFMTPREAYEHVRGEVNVRGISQREIGILSMYARGMTTKEIAKSLHISVGTVQSHTSHAARKLGVRQRFEAIRICQQQHLI